MRPARLLALALLAGCGSSAQPPPEPFEPRPGPATSTTSGGGFPTEGSARLEGELGFPVASTNTLATAPADGGGVGWVQVRLSDAFGACSFESSYGARVLISFGRPGGPPVAAGSYAVDAGLASVTLEDAGVGHPLQATGGVVVCNYAGPEGYVGNLLVELGLPDGGTSTISGFFTAPYCGP